MSAEEYNEKEIAAGRLTPIHIATLVEAWQIDHDLGADGYAGPKTQASLDTESETIQTEAPQPEPSDIGLAALLVAIEEIGNGEEGGNNSGEHIAKYKGIEDDGDDDDDGAWCASFASWCIEEACRRADIEMPFRRSGGAKRLYKNAGKVGEFSDDPAPGDLVCWDRGLPGSWQGHIGFVERVENGVLHTVEGNVGRYPSKVRRFVHDLVRETRLEGFARIPDAEE